MPRVYNATEETVSTRVQGSWFSFPPGALKNMSEDKANFIRTNRQETGLRVLPEEFDQLSEKYIEQYEKTDEGKKIMGRERELGISALITYHMDIIRNNQVSLRQDLAHRYPSADAAKLAAISASPGELDSMRLVAKYKKKNIDNDAKRAEEVDKLMEEIGPFVAIGK